MAYSNTVPSPIAKHVRFNTMYFDAPLSTMIYYIATGVLLENKPLIKFIRNCIGDLSGVFSISLQVKISMMPFPAFSWLFVFAWTLHVSSKIWILCSPGKNNILFLPREHKIHIFSPPYNILYTTLSLPTFHKKMPFRSIVWLPWR